MSRIVGVHGIAQHQLGRHQLLSTWRPALTDGLERASGRRVTVPGVELAFYGDMFLGPVTPGAKGGADADGIVDGLSDVEIEELVVAAAEVVAPEDLEAAERETPKGLTRVPRSLQVVLRALDRRFGVAAGVLHVGVLRQVRQYLTDPDLKARVDARVDEAVGDGCRVVIGHSLGSVVAYEHLRRHPANSIDRLVTLGSPLGLRMVRDRVDVTTLTVSGWINVRDVRDPVACAGDLLTWWPQVIDRTVDNGRDAHRVERYLSKDVTGTALLDVLPELAT